MQSKALREKQQALWKAKQAGEIPTRQHDFKDQVSELTTKRLAIEEHRELKEALGEYWDE